MFTLKKSDNGSVMKSISNLLDEEADFMFLADTFGCPTEDDPTTSNKRGELSPNSKIAAEVKRNVVMTDEGATDDNVTVGTTVVSVSSEGAGE